MPGVNSENRSRFQTVGPFENLIVSFLDCPKHSPKPGLLSNPSIHTKMVVNNFEPQFFGHQFKTMFIFKIILKN
jgi:hypothetical protein